MLNNSIPWENFRRICSKVHDKERKSPAGRKPLDPVMMFKVLVLQSLYNISDQQMEYQIKDRMSCMRFPGLNLEGKVPDATTLWSYRQALTDQGLLAPLFERFNTYLAAQSYQAKSGQIIDASIAFAGRKRTDYRDHINQGPGQTRLPKTDTRIHRNAREYLHRRQLSFSIKPEPNTIRLANGLHDKQDHRTAGATPEDRGQIEYFGGDRQQKNKWPWPLSILKGGPTTR
ncbi:MAG: transposase [Gammaproteobacteria bacterium]